MIGAVSDHFSFGIYDCGTAPEVQTILIAGSIGMHHKSGEEIGVALIILFYSTG
jgi:hypothetical protein